MTENIVSVLRNYMAITFIIMDAVNIFGVKLLSF